MFIGNARRGLRGLGLTQAEANLYTAQRAQLVQQYNAVMAPSCVGFGGEDAAYQQQMCEANKAAQAAQIMAQIQALDAILAQGVSAPAPAPAPAPIAPLPPAGPGPVTSPAPAPSVIAPQAGAAQSLPPGSPIEVEVPSGGGALQSLAPGGADASASSSSSGSGGWLLALLAAGVVLAGG